MSNETSLPAIPAVRTGDSTIAEPRISATSEVAYADPSPAKSPITNPTLRLDARLGLVVIEFRNDSGAITTSIPSQRQLAAYQRWETTRLGPAPAGQRGNSGSRTGHETGETHHPPTTSSGGR